MILTRILVIALVAYVAIAFVITIAFGFANVPFWITHVIITTTGGVAGAMALQNRQRTEQTEDDRT